MFFVAIDSWFFGALPKMREVANLESSEITWLIYDFAMAEGNYQMREPRVVHTTWEDVQTALREGDPPTIAQVLGEVRRKVSQKSLPVYLT